MSTEPPISFSSQASAANQSIKIKETIEKLMLVLSEKEKFIIQNRFSVGASGKNTLEAIGQHFGVTRERIRQIEKNAIKKLKRNAFATNLKFVNETAKTIIKKEGGLMLDKKLVEQLLVMLKNIEDSEINELKLSLTLDPELTRAYNTLQFEPHWRFNEVGLELVRKISNEGVQVLESKKEIISGEVLAKKLCENLGQKISESLALSVLEIDKRIKFVKEGIGLKDWRNINPKTLRDKIHFILDKENKPLHFREIAQKIRDCLFDNKRINFQAVHNELIRNERFVLIGRGLYALEKWGYKPGTVGDVIAKILSDGKTRTREEIMKEVLKQRFVKKITIYLNLKNDRRVQSLNGDRYRLAKGAGSKMKSRMPKGAIALQAVPQEA
ncbi:MAG: RNA polymerase sigma factor [uncultured bacterium]|nr:MAG: RNA polymerase sigma factor [uncultured bacterium]KKT77120.1 MAG: RNA polymerase sigma factor [Candidatus Peregrinibacteria bacterium GW2011_GWA2_44_7]